jgi:hypothetical protein
LQWALYDRCMAEIYILKKITEPITNMVECGLDSEWNSIWMDSDSESGCSVGKLISIQTPVRFGSELPEPTRRYFEYIFKTDAVMNYEQSSEKRRFGTP